MRRRLSAKAQRAIAREAKQQQTLFGEPQHESASKPQTKCQHCERDWFRQQTTINRCPESGAFTVICPSCDRILDQKQQQQQPKYDKTCARILRAHMIESLSDSVFDSVSGYDLRLDLLPWLWLGMMAPGIMKALTRRVYKDRPATFELQEIKAKANREYKHFAKHNNVNENKEVIEQQRRDFVEALKIFARG